VVDRPRVEVASRAEWRAWLEEHHATSDGIWLVTWKKGRGPYVPWGDVVQEALCFGWVDSTSRGLDEDRTMVQVTPRKRGSGWSRVNKEHVEKLLAAGLVAPAGLAVIEAAKADGSWSALDAVEALTEPPELTAALDAVPAARASWDGFPRSAKRAILEWIGSAKTDATRSKRVAETVSEAAEGRRANQWRPKP
jgi:uncharacterized protein YdeI (YjbR/CyaY-like superfamily)